MEDLIPTDRTTLYGTIKWYMEQGLTFNEAVTETESVLHTKFQEAVVELARKVLEE